MRDLMLMSANERAAHYREQVIHLREMAEREYSAEFRTEMLDLAAKYDALAQSVSLRA